MSSGDVIKSGRAGMVPVSPYVAQPDSSHHSLSEMVAAYSTLRQFYSRYSAAESLRRMDVLRAAVADVRETGLDISMYVGGSVSFGMAIDTSDNDCGVVANLKSHGLTRDDLWRPFTDAVNLHYGRPIGTGVTAIDSETIREVLHDPWIDPLKQQDVIQLYLWNLINIPVDDSAKDLTESIKRVRVEDPKFASYLDVAATNKLVENSSFYINSFWRYNQRLEERDIRVPQEIHRLIENLR